MGDLTEYEVEIDGVPHTFQLDADEAKRLGDRAVEVKRRKVEDKSRKPANKAASGSEK